MGKGLQESDRITSPDGSKGRRVDVSRGASYSSLTRTETKDTGDDTMTIFHIRRRLRRRGGNQFYLDTSERKTATYCGENVTDYDISWNADAVAFNGRRPCPQCIATRDKKTH